CMKKDTEHVLYVWVYGDPASANCSTSVSDAAGMGWEATFGGVGLTTAPTVHWAVKKLEVWDLQPLCFITLKNNDQCDKTLNITVYKTPDKVSILDNGPMVEGKEYHLKCDISDVVPADKVKVKWYRNDEYVQDMVSDTHVDPHNNNISAILTIIPKKDDNGANFTCVAELHLGENGPQPVPAATSEPYIAVVHCEFPVLFFQPAKHSPDVSHSDISAIFSTSTNAGVYICGATNKVGSMSRNVTLIMKGNNIISVQKYMK
uniref:Ig-like domain-containing protein n=1 Tax=Sphaeramia orbicularis TaxID=375764 RepID=A0A673BYT7_9TELE